MRLCWQIYLPFVTLLHSRICLRYMMRCAIWQHLHNLKNLKNTHGGVLLLVKLQVLTYNFTKSNTPPWVFFTFFKSYKCHEMAQSITYWVILIFVQDSHSNLNNFSLIIIMKNVLSKIRLTIAAQKSQATLQFGKINHPIVKMQKKNQLFQYFINVLCSIAI